jgi:hypothetical protein
LKVFFSISFLWIFFFSLWLILLLGVSSKAPGVLQLVHLRRLLAQKEQIKAELEQQCVQIQEGIEDFNANPYVRKSEIRRTLGYLAEDELMIEFVH